MNPARAVRPSQPPSGGPSAAPAATSDAYRERYRSLVEAIPDGFCIIQMLFDEDGKPVDYRFVEVNAAFEAETGLTRATGRTARELIANLEQSWIDAYARVAATRERAHLEEHSAALGRSFSVDAMPFGAPERNEVAVFFKDITTATQLARTSAFLAQLDDAVRPLVAPEAITATAARLLGEHLQVDRCAYADVDQDEDSFTIVGNYTPNLPSILGRYRLADFGSEVLRANRAGQPYVVSDVETDPSAGDDLSAYRAIGIRAVISVPLLKDGRFVAGMALHQRTPRAWTKSDVELLEAVASRCWESLQRARAARELQAGEAKLRTLAEAVPCIVWTCEPSGFLTYFNEQWAEYTGRDVEASLGFGWADTLHPDDRARVLERWQRSTATGDVYEGEARYRRHDGEYRYHHFRAVALRDANGAVQRWYGASLDVHELRAADQRFRDMANAAPAILWVTEPDGSCSFLSRGWSDFTGQPESEARGYGWLEPTHPEDIARVRQAFEAANAARLPFTVDYRLRRADGTYRWVLDVGRPRFGPNGDFLGYVGSVFDISERKQAEEARERILATERTAREEAERIGRMKDEFLATLSHELRTPLNAILGWSQLLRNDKVKDTRQAIETIERNARAQRQIVEDLLDMSAIIGGKVRLELQHLQLGDVVRAAAQSVEPTAHSKGVELVTTIAEGSGAIVGDPSRLQQVVWNLVANAVKFTPRGGRVDLVVAGDPAEATLTVRDSGIGIDPAFLPHVFERFAQGDASITRRFGGLGLGLSIVQQLVGMHNGRIEAASEGIGQGASFIVTLPRGGLRHSTPPPPPSSPSGPSSEVGEPSIDGVATSEAPRLADLKVLVVDDNPDARDVAARILETHDAKVVTAAGAVEALAVLARERVDVVVSDIHMPDVDGYDFVRAVRRLEREREASVPAVAVTAHARGADRTQALLAGFDAHVAKPIEPSELLVVVARVCGRLGRR